MCAAPGDVKPVLSSKSLIPVAVAVLATKEAKHLVSWAVETAKRVNVQFCLHVSLLPIVNIGTGLGMEWKLRFAEY